MFFYAVLFIFFLQLLTSFVGANYAFGLLNNRLPLEAVSAALMLSPTLLLLPHRWSRRSVTALVFIVVAARLGFPLTEDTRASLILSGSGVAAGLLLLPLLLHGHDGSPALMVRGLALALAASIAMRAIGSGLDASTIGTTQLVAWPVGFMGIWSRPVFVETSTAQPSADAARVVVLCVGMMASLTVLYSGFVAPAVIARWTGADYLAIIALILFGLLGWSLILHSTGQKWLTLGRTKAATAVFVAFLILTLISHQTDLPANVAVYPIAEASSPAWSTVALIVTCLLAPLLLLDFYAMARQVQVMRPSRKVLALGFGVGSGFLLVVILGQILTVTYDYVPVIGPAARERFWLVVAAPAVCVLAALFAVPTVKWPRLASSRPLALGLGSLAVLALGSAVYVQAAPESPPQHGSLRFATLNVHQGYSADNRRDPDGQLALLDSFDADVISLQESDTARVGGGNDDLVRFLANGLDMYSYYGPKTVAGTFGIALLSRYPIEDAQTFYLFSEGEQTAVISARITIDGSSLTLLVTHLGNGGPQVQQEEVLSLVPDRSDVLLLGDFNFRPTSAQYDMTIRQLDDAWVRRWPEGTDAQGSEWSDRIDYIFVSSGIEVIGADYVENRVTDHPSLVVEIRQ